MFRCGFAMEDFRKFRERKVQAGCAIQLGLTSMHSIFSFSNDGRKYFSYFLKCRLKLDLEIVFFLKKFLNCNVTLVFETDGLLLFSNSHIRFCFIRKKSMTAAVFSADGSVLAVAAETVITLWDPEQNILVAVIGETLTVHKVLSY